MKGTAISGRLAYARRRGGEEAVRQLVAAISDPQTRELLADGKALKSAWYPFSALIDVTLALDARFGKGDLALIEEIGGDVAEADLNGVYKLFMQMASPQYLMDKTASLWRNYYDSGEVVVTVRAEDHAVLELRNFDSPHRAHCLSVLGWIHRALVLCGVKEIQTGHSSCRALGHPSCLFESAWR